jgi:1-acyl-sn-glycerol-3-phosphate acyltransferase
MGIIKNSVMKKTLASCTYGIISAFVWLGFLSAVVFFSFLLFILQPLILKFDHNRKLAYQFMVLCAKTLLWANPLWTVSWIYQERLSSGGPYIITPNHTSFADAIYMALLPIHTKWITKAGIFRVPFIGIIMRLAGHISTLRGDSESGLRSIESSRDWLLKGVSILIFPEGTRSRDGQLGRFKSGAARLAIATQRPLLPVSLQGSFDSIRADSWLFKRSHIVITIGEPIMVDDTMKPATLSNVLRDRVQQMLETGPITTQHHGKPNKIATKIT